MNSSKKSLIRRDAPVWVCSALILLLAGLFVLLLVAFAGRTGLRAVLSFALTVLIIALVYGFDSRCAAAVSGSFLGILVTCVMGGVFTRLFQIHGAVMSYSESLLYTGYQHLDLTQIFMASIFVGASGGRHGSGRGYYLRRLRGGGKAA